MPITLVAVCLRSAWGDAIENTFNVPQMCSVNPELKGGHLGSWMATKDPSLNAAENDFPIEI